MLRTMAFLWLLLGWVGFARSMDLPGEADVRTVDFGPQKDWQERGAVQVRSDGRISLTEDGRGIVWKRVELDMDAFPMMLVRVSQSFPRARWMVVAERNDPPTFDEKHAIRLIEKFAEEGGFFIPLKQSTGWNGKVKFILMIVLEGHKGDWMEFDNLEAIRLTNAKPAPPRLSVPAQGSVVSPMAVHFSWYQTAGAVEYELQISRRRNFSAHKSFRVKPPYLADQLPYLPEEERGLDPGGWSWRVRAINIAGQPGDWSMTGMFRVKEAAVVPRAPELSLSPAHPLVVLFGEGTRLAENWKSVPAELKPYTVLRVEALPTEELRKILATAQENQIPVVFQASGPHDYYGPISSRIPLAQIEQILVHFPVVKGVYICEQAFRVSAANNRIMMNYAQRLISLAAAYGKAVLWADGHWGRNLWIDVGLNKSLLETMRKYHEYFIPLWKMNGALTPYSAHDAVFGFWVSRAVDNWGVQPERWYWYEAGFRKLGQQFWFKEGETGDFPPTFYGQMILLGLSGGACVYSFEPADDIWGRTGGLSEISQQVTFPLLLEMIRKHSIPGREQVLARMRTIYVADVSDSPWSLDYGTMHALYAAAYGVHHPFQMIPLTGRYFRLPIVSKWTPPAILESFPERLGAEKFPAVEQARAYLNERYPSHDRGDAWVVGLDNLAIAMNSLENRDVNQTFEMAAGGKIKKITGQVGVNSYVLAQNTGDGLRMQLNGRAGRSLILNFWADEEPQQITVKPQRAWIHSSWDATDRRLLLELLPNQAAVNVEIGFSEKAVK